MPVKVLNSVAGGELESTLRALQAEVAGLREENAQLRLARFRLEAQPGRLEALVQMRSTAAGATVGPDGQAEFADAGWDALTQAVVVRDVLLEMCDEVTALTGRLADRLRALSAWDVADPRVDAVDRVAAGG